MTIIDDIADLEATPDNKLRILTYPLGGHQLKKFSTQQLTPMGSMRLAKTTMTLDDFLIQRGAPPMSQRRMVMFSYVDDKDISSEIANSVECVQEPLRVYHAWLGIGDCRSLFGWYPTPDWVAGHGAELQTIPPGWRAARSHQKNTLDLGGVLATPNAMMRMNEALLPDQP